MLADPKEARANITPVHFLPFNPVEKRTIITYIDSEGTWHKASKGAPEQRTGARDEGGNPLIKDYYSTPLTASGNLHDDTLLSKLETVYTDSGDHGSSSFVFNMEQGLPVLPEWLCFNRVNAQVRKGVDVGPARLLLSLSRGHVVGNFSPHESFAIGGTNTVRGYKEGVVGSGRSYVVGSGEISFPMISRLYNMFFI